MDRLRRLGRDEGQTATEFIGVLAAVALVVALLAASSIAQVVRSSSSSTTCAVLNNPGCGGPGSLSPISLDPPSGARAEPADAPADAPAGSGAYDADAAEQNLADNVLGFFRGAEDHIDDMIVGLWDTAVWGWRSATSHEQRVENGLLWEQIRADPGAAALAIWDGITEPVVAEWEAGRPGAAIGRGAVEIAGIFFGGKGLNRLRSLTALNRADDAADATRGLAALDDAAVGRYVDLVSPTRRRHILDGDATGGGHRGGLGLSGKSEFPTSWSDDRVIHEISDVATDPNSTFEVLPTGRTRVTGTRDGIDILVVLDRQGNIVTGFPTNVPRNP